MDEIIIARTTIEKKFEGGAWRDSIENIVIPQYRLSNFRKMTFDTDFFETDTTFDININYQKNKFGFEAGERFDLFKVKTTEFGVLDSINYFPPLDLTFNSVNCSAGATYKLNKYLIVK